MFCLSSTTGENCTQTEPPPTKDSEIQAPESSCVEVQTDPPLEVGIVENFDENALAAYLTRVVPAVLEELDKIATSHAFDNYNPFSDDDQSYNVSLLKTFTSSDVSEEFQVTKLSWNSSGSIIAAAFYRRILKIAWTDKISNKEVIKRIVDRGGWQLEIMKDIKRRKMQYCWHIIRAEGLQSNILLGRLEGKRSRGRPRKKWLDDVKKWGRFTKVSSLVTTAKDRVNFGAKQHEEWCDHDNVKLLCWNLDRIIDTNKPCSVIELDTCVTSISFHPTLSSMIAIGDFSGRVMVYNTSEDEVDMMIGSSGVTDEETIGHREPITSLHWTEHTDKSPSFDYQLISGSLDGKILIWTLKIKERILEAEEGFQILAGNLPVKLSKEIVRSNCEVGITSISQNCEDPAILIISTEGGGIFQCNLNSNSIASSSIPSPIPLKNPLVFGYTAHKSHSCSSEFSLVRNGFISCGFDGQISLFSLLQSKPILVIQRDVALTSIRWSPIRPLVFIATSHDGKLLLFDLDEDQTSPVVEVPVLEDNFKKLKPMTCAEFNAKE
ncbi:WD repeat-containing protein 34 [Nymphon striatum]|nr:WD repeat-containing protein 34 [Nymphon striatum]